MRLKLPDSRRESECVGEYGDRFVQIVFVREAPEPPEKGQAQCLAQGDFRDCRPRQHVGGAQVFSEVAYWEPYTSSLNVAFDIPGQEPPYTQARRHRTQPGWQRPAIQTPWSIKYGVSCWRRVGLAQARGLIAAPALASAEGRKHVRKERHAEAGLEYEGVEPADTALLGVSHACRSAEAPSSPGADSSTPQYTRLKNSTHQRERSATTEQTRPDSRLPSQQTKVMCSCLFMAYAA